MQFYSINLLGFNFLGVTQNIAHAGDHNEDILSLTDEKGLVLFVQCDVSLLFLLLTALCMLPRLLWNSSGQATPTPNSAC